MSCIRTDTLRSLAGNGVKRIEDDYRRISIKNFENWTRLELIHFHLSRISSSFQPKSGSRHCRRTSYLRPNDDSDVDDDKDDRLEMFDQFLPGCNRRLLRNFSHR